MSKEKRKFYMCLITWRHEVGATRTMLFDTLEELKEHHSCWKECGVVELTVDAEEIIPEDRELMLKNAYRDKPDTGPEKNSDPSEKE